MKDGETIRIGRIVRGGMIDNSAVMKEGDELLKINDIELSKNMSIDDVCDLLASLTGRVHFLLRPTKNSVLNGHIHHSDSRKGARLNGAAVSGELYNSRTNTATSIFDEQVVSSQHKYIILSRFRWRFSNVWILTWGINIRVEMEASIV